MRLNLGIDVDNVLYPWTTAITRWVEHQKGLAPGTLDDEAQTWTWFKDQWDMTSEEFTEHMRSGIAAGVIFRKGHPSQGSVSALRRLHTAGHRIHYVTDRSVAGPGAWGLTHAWLHKYGFPVDSITITADKSSVPTDVFLDDGLHNIAALLDAGHPRPLLWVRSHNRTGVEYRRHPFVEEVETWHEFERRVQDEAWDREEAA